MSQDWLLGTRNRFARRMLRIWQGYEALGIEGTIFHADDDAETKFNLELPSWPWRWVCWLQGHSDSTYGDCVICRKVLR